MIKKYPAILVAATSIAAPSGCRDNSHRVNSCVGTIVFAPWMKDDSTIRYIDDTNGIVKFNESWLFTNGMQGTEQCGYDYEVKRIDQEFKAGEFSLINMRCGAVTIGGFVYHNQMAPVSAALQSAKQGIMELDTIRGDINTWIEKIARNPNFIGYELIDTSAQYQYCYKSEKDGGKIVEILRSQHPHELIWDEPDSNKRFLESKRYPFCISEPIEFKSSLDSAKIPYAYHEVGVRAYAFMRNNKEFNQIRPCSKPKYEQQNGTQVWHDRAE